MPTRQLLTAIDFVDDKHGWAVGHDATVLSTGDGGQSWQVQYEDREREAPCSTCGSKTPSTALRSVPMVR